MTDLKLYFFFTLAPFMLSSNPTPLTLPIYIKQAGEAAEVDPFI